ncbi:MAG TPA: hypothetical protein VGS08_05660 [Candidatus Saccharimonadales bacterium]|nr:hypothetical protein [Candidatus Saccharimonadales bacterium]
MSENNSPEAIRVTQRIEHIFGLRRTGHHAVLAWLQDCYRAKGLTTHHANSVFNEHLRWGLHSPDPNPKEIWQEATGSDVLLANYEDVAYADRRTAPVYNALQAERTDLPARDTVIVRDWYNMVASRLKYIANADEIGRYTITAALDWPIVARRWVDHATTLVEPPSGTSSFVGINYSRWLVDRDYRESLAACYDLPNSESTLDTVSAFGLGSSFNGFDKDGQAREMNLLRRWQDLETIELRSAYLAAIDVDRFAIDALNRHLFGFGYSEVAASLEHRDNLGGL